MSDLWVPVRERDKYGIVIQSFNGSGLHRISLTLGESVYIIEENGDWYYGFSTKNTALRGIFPKAYVKVMESIIDKSGPNEVIILKQSPIVQEITAVLREWGTIWKHLYITNSEHFPVIQKKMYDLMFYKSKITSGTLPVDELKQIKKLVTSKIDVGNKILGLDMVVRDEQGNVLNPETTSTIQLYIHHQRAADRIKKATSEVVEREEKKPVAQQYCHILFVSVRNFICKLTDDCELLMYLYDGKEGKSFTENFVVRWPKPGSPAHEIDRVHNALFTDLGARDLVREKVYLVCYVVKLGGMEKSNNGPKTVTSTDSIVRRPYGVAAMDITLYINGKLEPDEDKHHFLPLIQCDKDNLDGTLKRILTLKELTQKDHKGQGLSAGFKMLHGDIKQVREENPHLVMGQISVARKMGFPEVILPGDVRNDLYLTLVSGDFSKGSKTTDKNVQVSVTVCNEKGQVLQSVIKAGGGIDEESEYRSVVYHHEDKPRWSETCKVAVPIDDFKASHLKFTFRHRSSNEAKDKNEKPFALSYVRLMQENGTTLPDTQHELLVYKVDHKKYDPQDVSYLSLPATRGELEDGNKPTTYSLSLANKDSFVIQTNVCSTKLTQNVDLLGLLNWVSQPPGQLSDSLKALMKVSGEEIVKFLQDVLDALFNILMQNSDSDIYDNMVFNCLLYIIGLVSDRKYQHFQPVLDMYIKESFSATLAYKKLLVVLNSHIMNVNGADPAELLKAMKSLQYIIRFIVKSKLLFSELNEGKDQSRFVNSMQQMLQSIGALMKYNTDATLLVQGACLKYLPSTIPDILSVFNPIQLSQLLAELINNLPPQRLAKQKMMTLRDLVHSPLFLKSDCRRILLPVVLKHIKELIEARDEVELCVKILSDIMDSLFYDETGPTTQDLTEIMMTILRTVIQSTIVMDRESPLVGNLVAVMLSILRQMSVSHFETYINHFATPIDLLDFLMEILLVFEDLVSSPVYPNDWCEIIMLQNSIILKSLRSFSHTIRDYFSQVFESQAWNNFFHCAISFLTQPALQLETFSTNKRWRIISRYKDMRRETGFEIRSMWFNLGQHKIYFIPSLVGPFLEMTLIPEVELRRATIPIFFDMMQCEFYSPRDKYAERYRDSTNIRANFHEFENEMIMKLDNLMELGAGDEHYKDLFKEIMMSLCENHSTMKEQGVRFVKTVTRLMERLLEYRCIIKDENKENKMSCTVNLLHFYLEINRKEMYIRYVNKLCELHLECDNYTEAAYTLKLYSKLLNWSDKKLSLMSRTSKYQHCQTHRQLKEALYRDILDYFNQGKMWECAIEVCKELVEQYEDADLHQLSDLLRKMAEFYDNIRTKLRPEPEYFRVAYYGKGFPAFLQNKVFVYRGKEYERLSDFCTRTLNQLPNAELMNTLTPPSEEIMNSPVQYVQINKVEPVMEGRRHKSNGRPVSDQILKYYRVNNVQKFRFSRPFHRKDSTTDEDNEFSSLWVERNVLVTSYPLPGILRWFPVTSSTTFQLNPLANAIETMQISNKSLKELIIQHQTDPNLQLSPLSMKLNGIVDAAVMGGINNYEKAFFSAEYMERHPEHLEQINELKELIAGQIPLLEVGIRLHGELAPPSLEPFHNRLLQCFTQMQAHVISNYGAKSCDIKFEGVSFRRQMSTSANDSNRLSGTSFGSNEASSVHVRASSARSSTVFSSGGSTLSRKEKKKKRRNSNNRESLDTNRSQWFMSSISSASSLSGLMGGGGGGSGGSSTAPGTPLLSGSSSLAYQPLISTEAPVVELNQQLTPSRPLRSEVEKEKRLSRPPSGQINTPRQLSITSSNRDSIGTTDSTASEEDGVPPPLPAKLREADYCNLPEGSNNNPILYHTTPRRVRNKPMPPEPLMDGESYIIKDSEPALPPTPPPKRPNQKLPIS